MSDDMKEMRISDLIKYWKDELKLSSGLLECCLKSCDENWIKDAQLYRAVYAKIFSFIHWLEDIKKINGDIIVFKAEEKEGE